MGRPSRKKGITRSWRGMEASPGGWHCPCCGVFGCLQPNKKNKQKAKRSFRRTNKVNQNTEENE